MLEFISGMMDPALWKECLTEAGPILIAVTLGAVFALIDRLSEVFPEGIITVIKRRYRFIKRRCRRAWRVLRKGA